MAKVTLFCPEPSGLKLGPSAAVGEYIQFVNGWASFEEEEFPSWKAWVDYPDTPHIEVIPEESGEVDPASAEAFECPVCGKAFKAKIGMTGHMRSHKPEK